METRRLISAILIAMAAFVAYQYVVNKIFPPAPPAAPGTPPAPLSPDGTSPLASSQPAAVSGASTEYQFSSAPLNEAIRLGGGAGDALEVELSSRGASISRMLLTARKTKPAGEFVHRARADGNEPYEIVTPVRDEPLVFASYTTQRVWVSELGNRSWPLDQLSWETLESGASAVVFVATLRNADGGEMLRLTKRYELVAGKPLINLTLSAQNVGPGPLTVRIEQNTATGLHHEVIQQDVVRLLGVHRDKTGTQLDKARDRTELLNYAKRGETIRLIPADNTELLWTALTNKFFGVFTRPLVSASMPGDAFQFVDGLIAIPGSDAKLTDLTARLTTRAAQLEPGSTRSYALEIYAGPKDKDALAAVNPSFIDAAGVNYALSRNADLPSCVCTFEPLPTLMSWLLHTIQFVVRNFGLAIFGIVLIVRSALHPLAVFQQKSMYKMQESMGRLHPKMEALKEKYANDKVRLNQELMRLYAEENVNPAASLVAFVPLFIQMPILVALWTALNSDIHLRHAPFDGWWIRDLSAPDSLVHFAGGITIPLLGWVLPWMFANIPSFNLLPILMGVSMYLQQKYMPKPKFAQQATATPRRPGALTPEEQLRQTQMVGYMMCFLFPLMFYYMPSGLCLYWMATNVFGIGESLRIRRQIEAEKARRAAQGSIAPPPRKPGLLSRTLKRMAEKAEEFQKQADALSQTDKRRKG